MEFEKVLENRKSIRKFKPSEISDNIVYEILKLSQLAPSAGNGQSYKVKIIRSEEDREKLRQATMSKQESLITAPVVLAIFADKEESGKKYGERGEVFYSIQDATIFAAYVQLVISSKGFDSVWIGGFLEDEIRKSLNISENLKPVAFIPFGLPDAEPRIRERKGLEDILLK